MHHHLRHWAASAARRNIILARMSLTRALDDLDRAETALDTLDALRRINHSTEVIHGATSRWMALEQFEVEEEETFDLESQRQHGDS